jgi:hypothetical protein
MSASILPVLFRSIGNIDWTQRELAEFYRVETVLIQSGVLLETDRGMSDEGDPWFVFCRAQTGDVIVHFARNKNEYIAAGGGLDGVLRGRSFRDIIDKFMNRQPLRVSGGKDRPTTVFLHPTALMCAFVATAFFLLSSSDAEASIAGEEGKDGTAPASLVQARMPVAFHMFIEAAALTGNRDAWITISTIAIAVSIGISGFQSESETHSLGGANIEKIAGIIIDFQGPYNERSESYGSDFLALVDSSNMSFDSRNDPLLEEAAIEITNSGAVVSANDQGLGKPTSKDNDFFLMELEQVSLSGSIACVNDDFFHLRSFNSTFELPNFGRNDELTLDRFVAQLHDTASEAYLLMLESLEIANNVIVSEFLKINLVELVSVTAHQWGALIDYVSVEINFTDETINFAVFDENSESSIKDIRAEVGSEFDMDAGPHAGAMRALEWFAQSHPNFKFVSIGGNVVVFDMETINEVQVSIIIHSWTMDDGSTINILGTLPDAVLIAV